MEVAGGGCQDVFAHSDQFYKAPFLVRNCSKAAHFFLFMQSTGSETGWKSELCTIHSIIIMIEIIIIDISYSALFTKVLNKE